MEPLKSTRKDDENHQLVSFLNNLACMFCLNMKLDHQKQIPRFISGSFALLVERIFIGEVERR